MNYNNNPQSVYFNFSDQCGSPIPDKNQEDLQNKHDLQKKHENRLVQKRNRELLGDEHWKNRSQNEPTMGVWKRRKGRCVMYTDLTGRELTGRAAKEQANADEAIINGDDISDRQYLITNIQNESKDLFSNNNDNNNSLDMTRLETWGLPPSTVESYNNGGVEGLYQWQVNCLLINNGTCLKDNNPSNLLFTAPTSGGKTLVAEIMMLRTLAKQKKRGGIILFVVPFVAVAIEKATYFRKIWKTLHIGVRSFDGETSAISSDVDVVVATFEKANMIMNDLLNPEDSKDPELHLLMLVVDELHLLQDNYRGYMLEVLITKALHLYPTVQIVGMTATLPNLLDIAQWMQAECCHTEERPIQLPVRLLYQGQLHQYRLLNKNKNEKEKKDIIWHPVRKVSNINLNIPHDREKVDTDSLICMVKETLESGGNVLVFCARKKWCKGAAKTLTAALKLHTYNCNNSSSSGSSSCNGNEPNQKFIVIDNNIKLKREMLLRNLSNTVFGLDEDLKETIPMGIAWHHSGLTIEEKKLIEAAYQDNTLCVLVATSTLSAGVNLPANRVIIRSLNMGPENLPVNTFRQMCGRAGRTGIARGNSDAIVMVNDKEFERGKVLITSPLPDLESSLKASADVRIVGLCKLLLDGIVTKRVKTLSQAKQLCRSTLYSFHSNNNVDHNKINNEFDEAKNALIERKFISQQQSNEDNNNCDGDFEFVPGLYSTALGCAAVKAGISASLSREILTSLHAARQHLIVKTNYHLIYLCTPPSRISVQWNYFSSICSQVLNEFPEIKPILQLVGVKENEINGQVLPTHRRPFYQHIFASLVLYGLVMEKPLPNFSNMMELDRGAIQSLQSQASLYSIQLVAFCEHLNWGFLANALRPISKRISSCSESGVTDDIRPLVTTLGQQLMPPFRAKIFYQQGLRTVYDFVKCNPSLVVQILRRMQPHEQEPIKYIQPMQTIEPMQSHTTRRGLIARHNTFTSASSTGHNPIARRNISDPISSTSNSQRITTSQLSARIVNESCNHGDLEKLAKSIINRAQEVLEEVTANRNK